jgi:hypothetical protein
MTAKSDKSLGEYEEAMRRLGPSRAATIATDMGLPTERVAKSLGIMLIELKTVTVSDELWSWRSR